MRLHARNLDPNVYVDRHANRSIILRLGTLRFTMTTTEAIALADTLHDAAEEIP